MNLGSVAAAAIGLFLVARRGISPRFVIEAIVLGALLWASDWLLICTNVERVHYPQYALLGFLIRCLVDSDVLALLAGNLIGMVDETLQYTLNPHYTKYLDFNDMILNMIGVILGIALWRWCRRCRSAPGLLPLWKRTTGAAYGLLAAVVAGAILLGKIIPYWPVTGIPHTALQHGVHGAAFVLSYVDLPDFWLVTGLGRQYHVMDAAEWGMATAFLLCLAWLLTRLRQQNRTGLL